jgi:hypothetical protein
MGVALCEMSFGENWGEKNNKLLLEIQAELNKFLTARLSQLTVKLGKPARRINMADTLVENQNAPIVVTGADQFGNPFSLAGLNVALSLSDATLATIDDSNPASPMLDGIPAAAGGPEVLTAAVTRADGTVISGTDSITMTAVPPPAPVLTTVSVSLGTPVPQPAPQFRKK